MATVEANPPPVEPASAEAPPALPDYLASPNAVFNDVDAKWRYGKAPDYSKTRKVWEEGKTMKHAAGSLPQLVENLVKNWEVEASFKPRLEDWRTIDHNNYSFAMNGGPPQSGHHMLKVGTYNAVIAPNEYYSPENSDFASSHKTFKRMMPTFAWEVVEVFSGPPRVAFKWRHWGVMKSDYVGFNNKGEKVVAKAHGGPIEIFGITVANVDDKVRLQAIDTWMDSLDMFRQIAPNGVVAKEGMNRNVSLEAALDAGKDDVPANETPTVASEPATEPSQTGGCPFTPQHDGVKIAEEFNNPEAQHIPAPEDVMPKHISNSTGQPADAFVPHQGADTEKPVLDDPEPSAATAVVEAAAKHGADTELEYPESNFHDAHEQQPEVAMDVDQVPKSVSAREDADMSVDQPMDAAAAPPAVDASIVAAEMSPTDDTSPMKDEAVASTVDTNVVTAAKPSADVTCPAQVATAAPSDDTTGRTIPANVDEKTATSDDVEPTQPIHVTAPTTDLPRSIYSSAVTGNLEDRLRPVEVDEQKVYGTYDAIDKQVERSAGHAAEQRQQKGEAVVVPAAAEETRETHEEMSRITDDEAPALMNRE